MKQYFRYMAGRMETPADRPLIRKVAGRFPRVAVSLQRADGVVSTIEGIPRRRED